MTTGPTEVWTRDCAVPERESSIWPAAVPCQRVRAPPLAGPPPYCTAEQLPGGTQLPHKSSRAFPLPEPLLANEMSPMAASGGSLTNWTLELVIFGGVNAHLSAIFYAAVAVG
jgi:hypothetical protein